MNIKWHQYIEICESKGASDSFLEWANSHEDWPESVKFVHWQLKHVSEHVPDHYLNACTRVDTYAAMLYTLHRFTDEQVWDLAQKRPVIALECAQSRLTDEQVWKLAMDYPLAGLCYAIPRLNNDQIWKLAQKDPMAALAYVHRMLTDDQIWELSTRDCSAGLKFVRHRLSTEQIQYLKFLQTSQETSRSDEDMEGR